jgi:ferredoxin--NADP+ reductase
MPNVIIRKRKLIPGMTSELVIKAPHIAAKALPGNFVILRVWEEGERIPLTIADADKQAGTITLVYLVMGKTTAHLETLDAGDDILDLCGPLGRPTEIHKVDGPVICVGGGTGIAAMHHIAKGHHMAGNRVVTIIGATNCAPFAPRCSSPPTTAAAAGRGWSRTCWWKCLKTTRPWPKWWPSARCP